MPAWIAALFVGSIVIGLSERPSSRLADRLALILIVVVLSYEAFKIRAI